MSRDLALHATVMLAAHRKWCRASGHAFPEVFAQLLDALAAGGVQAQPATEQFAVARDGASYSAAHKWVWSQRGPAADHDCAHCGRPARHWAYDHRDPDERVDPKCGLVYSLNPGRYRPLCGPCHGLFDDKRGQARTFGQPYSTLRDDQTVVPLLVDSAAAARRLGVSVRTLRRMTKDGRLPAVKVGGAVRFRLATLEQYAHDLEVKSA